MSNKAYDFRSIVYFDSNKQEKMYTVFYGLSDKNTKIINQKIQGIPGARSQLKPQYLMFSDNKNQMFIRDVIEQKEYILKDNIPEMKWELQKDKKKIGNKELSKAYTEFRGRKYTVWYDPDFKISIAPWKFNGLPGLVYKIHDDLDQISWELTTIKETSEPLENPFSEAMKKEAISYKNYPKLRYGLSERMKKLLKNNPDNKMVEQERNGLEIKFEWE
jgi:GLPGLI family protein